MLIKLLISKGFEWWASSAVGGTWRWFNREAMAVCSTRGQVDPYRNCSRIAFASYKGGFDGCSWVTIDQEGIFARTLLIGGLCRLCILLYYNGGIKSD